MLNLTNSSQLFPFGIGNKTNQAYLLDCVKNEEIYSKASKTH